MMLSYDKNNENTYVLEKIWKYSPNLRFTLNSSYFTQALIRQCDASYMTYRKFILKIPCGRMAIKHMGAIAWYSPKSSCFKTIEEFIVNVNLKKMHSSNV